MSEFSQQFFDLERCFAKQKLGGVDQELKMLLSRPATGRQRVPILVWFHAGAFRYGKYYHWAHRKLSRHLADQNIAFAAPQYRLKGQRKDLTEKTRAEFRRLRSQRSEKFNVDLTRASAFAALEDSILALNWLKAHWDAFSLNGRIVIGGSSAGAINCFNIAFTAPHIGLDAPKIGGIYSCSGAYAYPHLFEPGRVAIYAQHSPNDPKVPIDSIREVKSLDDEMTLFESNAVSHGGLSRTEGETFAQAADRIAKTVKRMSGTG